jgi:fructosamine-3-kinase
MFGFETTTFCGDTSLENGWCESWSEFFAERRLRVILRRYEEKYGEDGELRDAIGGVCERVVGRLLGDGRSYFSFCVGDGERKRSRYVLISDAIL